MSSKCDYLFEQLIKHLTRQTGCQDTIDECSRLEPRDCYSKYYATTCCRTCRVLIENPWDSNCLYGDKGVLCSYLVPEVCHITTRYCCQTCAAHPTPSKTTDDTSASPSQIITPNNASLTSLSKIFCFDSQLNQSDEIVLLIVLKLCYVVLGHSEVGEKLQRVARRCEVDDRNFVVERL